MKNLYIKIKTYLKKEKEYHIQNVPYSKIIRPDKTSQTCLWYAKSLALKTRDLEEHCKSMHCNGHTLYFCWTPQKKEDK